MQDLFGYRCIFRIERPIKRYSFENGASVRLRAHTLGYRNDVAIKEIGTEIGTKTLLIIAQTMGHARLRGQNGKEETVPGVYLVPDDLSPEAEREADRESGGVTRFVAVERPRDVPVDASGRPLT